MGSAPRSWRIGVLCNHIGGASRSYENEAVRALEEVSLEYGLGIVYFPGRFYRTSSGEKLRSPFPNNIASARNVDGLVVLSSVLSGYQTAADLEEGRRGLGGLPLVSVGIRIGDAPCVAIDNLDAMRRAIGHLADAHGARRIAFVKGPEGNAEAEDRFRGYLRALEERGMPYDPGLVAPGDFLKASGGKAVALFAARPGPAYDALAASNDEMALGALEALAALGRRCPEDVLVCGFDDLESARISVPAVTTMRQEVAEMVKRAVMELLGSLEGGRGPLAEIPAATLLPRASCGCGPLSLRGAPEHSPPDSDFDVNAQKRAALKRDRVDFILGEIGEVMIGVRSLGQLAQALSAWLGRLDINGCAIGLGDPGPEGKGALRPVIRYARGEGAEIDSGRELLPSSLVAEAAASRILIVESLSLGGEHFGIAVFGLGEPLGAVTAALRRQLCGALKNIRAAEEGERKRREILALNADLQRQLSRISSLRLIDTAITGDSGSEVLLETLLEQTMIQLGVDAASILLAKEGATTLEFGAGRGFRTEALRHTRLAVGEGFAGRAARDRELVLVRDLDSSPESLGRAPLLRDEGFVAYCAAPLFARGELMGVLEVFTRSPASPDGDWKGFLEALAGQAAIALDNMALVRGLRDANSDLLRAYDETIEGWSRALDLRDRETEGHSLRVADRSVELGRVLGLGSAELSLIYRGALLHDIGKVGIPDAVLLKQGPLDEDEKRLMRMHPRYAYDLLYPIEYLRPVIDIPYCHHERWDGTGYPRALRGEGIPLHARVFAVIDVWDALISDRPYRKAWAKESAVDHIARGSARHFDPSIVAAFLGSIR